MCGLLWVIQLSKTARYDPRSRAIRIMQNAVLRMDPLMVLGFTMCWCKFCFKSNLSIYSLYYAEACNKLAGPNSASLRPGTTTSFEKMLLRLRVVGNTVTDLIGPRFGPQTPRSRDGRITALPTLIGCFKSKIVYLVR